MQGILNDILMTNNDSVDKLFPRLSKEMTASGTKVNKDEYAESLLIPKEQASQKMVDAILGPPGMNNDNKASALTASTDKSVRYTGTEEYKTY